LILQEETNMPLAPQVESLPGHPPPIVPTEPIWRFSVEQYHEMIRTGILTEDDPVELLDGFLVPKMTKSRAHTIATRRAREAIERVVPAGWYVDAQEPVTLATSEPEPDTSVVRGKPEDYPDSQPTARDVALVVEVADATLRRDRNWKKSLYADAGVPAYWLVNLSDNQIEVYTDPSGPTQQPDYHQRRDFRPSEEVPLLLEGREVGRVQVAEVLP
jgi:Uma2 family endonuclease